MKRETVKKVLINTAIAGMIAGAGIGCSRNSEQKRSGANTEPTAVSKNGCGGKDGCGGKNGCQGAAAETKGQEAPEKSGDRNACRATGDRKATPGQEKPTKDSCAGKAGCSAS